MVVSKGILGKAAYPSEVAISGKRQAQPKFPWASPPAPGLLSHVRKRTFPTFFRVRIYSLPNPRVPGLETCWEDHLSGVDKNK